MSEQTPQPGNIEPEPIELDNAALSEQPRSARNAGLVNFLSHISITQMTLVVLAVIFLWQWQAGHRAINDIQQQLANKIAEMNGGSKANQILLAQSQEQVRELAAKVAALETRYAEAQNQRAALEALYADMSASRDESALADVEQMLLIAAQQLQLSSNVKVAMIAMQSADARLQSMNRPAFNTLRKAISQDMDKLRALPNVDISGASYQLDNLMASVDELPLAYQQRVATEVIVQTASLKDETAMQKLLREIAQEMKQLVRIENTGKAEIPLLPPNQEFFLRENLKLRLMSAHLALVSRDEESFRQELKTAQLWIARHFDGKSNECVRMLSGLKKLAATSIHIELPDISPSLQAVRNYRLTHENEPRASFGSRTRPR
ncbi:MAG: uroporphyrinogen-III C-methyltransferase [Nitrosomonadales bacterium]|nr:uroporphyrinogen-III C-methyltransferase [Nitrosomonadales bacterium]